MTQPLAAAAAALAFIEAHLCDPITVGDIAQAAGYSLFHFIRTFNGSVRHTPYDYLMRRRLSHAALRLLESEDQVLEIALACQFESHEGFTRAFGRMFGLPPSAWREQGFADRRKIMPALTEEDLVFRQNSDLLKPDWVYLEKQTLVGWMCLDRLDEPALQAFTSLFKRNFTEEYDSRKFRDLWAVRTHAISISQPELVFIGFEARGELSSPDRWVTKSISPGDYLRLGLENQAAHQAAHQAEAENYLFHTLLPRLGLRLAGPFELIRLEKSPAIYLPVVKKGLVSGN